MTYAIAERFTEEERRYAVSLHYASSRTSTQRRTAKGHCPIGACFHARGIVANNPFGQVAADILATRGTREWGEVNTEAVTFMNDWDNNVIKDLAKALGVKP